MAVIFLRPQCVNLIAIWTYILHYKPSIQFNKRGCHNDMNTIINTSWAGNSPVTGEFPAQRQVTRSFDVLFDLRLKIRLSKQSWGCWFEKPSRPLWCHSNDYILQMSFCIEPSICCFTFPCVKHIFSGMIVCYVMYVASSLISFASLLATSSDTEKCVKLYVHAMLMYLIVSFEK